MNSKDITSICFLQNLDLFKGIERKILLEISQHLQLLHVLKGSELLLKEEDKDFIFFLRKGTVKIVVHPNNYTKYVIKEGNIFGELSLIDYEAEENQFNDIDERAVALESAIIYYIKANQMRTLMNKYSVLTNRISILCSNRARKLELRIEDLLYKDEKTRISEYLLYYLLEFGKHIENRVEAKKLLSNSDIAHLTHTSRQTVNSVMNSMRAEGIIEYDSKKIYKTYH